MGMLVLILATLGFINACTTTGYYRLKQTRRH
jgi:hypothetical protein